MILPSDSGEDLLADLLHAERSGMIADLLNVCKRDILKSVALTYVAECTGDLGLQTAVADKNYSYTAERLVKALSKMADRGKNGVKLAFLDTVVLHFSERSIAPAIVCAAEDEDRIDLIAREEAL